MAQQRSLYRDIKKGKGLNAELILIAGGSCSGKSHFSKKLKESLEKKGEKVLLLDSDNFYKGCSRTIVEKSAPHFGWSDEEVEKITKIVYNITINYENMEKINEENRAKLKRELADIVSNPSEVVAMLKKQFENINYDEPWIINLALCANFINIMLFDKEKTVKLPIYSKKISDITWNGALEFTGKNYTKIIIEGLYALNDELLKKIKYKNPTKCFIDCDIYTLLFRRLNRDFNKGISGYKLHETLKMFLTKAMGGYNKYILPDREKADVIYTSIPEAHEKGHFVTIVKGGKVEALDFIFDDGREKCVFLLNELEVSLKEPKAFAKLLKQAGYEISVQEK